ncbi:MAG: hypothetical protein ACREMY_27095, partial [bacterium]
GPPDPNAIENWIASNQSFSTPEVTVASAATTDIGALNALRVAVAGTTTITSFGSKPNRIRFLRFTGALTLTYNATSLVIPGAASVVTALGDTCIAVSDSSGNWRIDDYMRANGSSLVLPARKNWLYNSSFAVCQRGNSFAISSSAYTVDRWKATRFGTARLTVTKQPISGSGQPFRRVRLQRDAGDTSTRTVAFYQALQAVEVQMLQGQQVTLSFYASVGANFSPTSIRARIITGNSVDEGADAGLTRAWTGWTTHDATVVPTTTRTRYSQTVTLPVDANELLVAFQFSSPRGTAGADDWIDIDSPKLELGAFPTTYEQPDPSQELERCYQFYEDFARDPFLGTSVLNVPCMAFANGAG